MTLLPLVGWAADYDVEVRVYGGEQHFTYGAITVPTTNAQKAEMLVCIPSTLSEEVKQKVAEKLQYTSTLAATSNVGTYNYTLSLISAGDRQFTVESGGDYYHYTITVSDPAGSFVVDKATAAEPTAAPEFVTEALTYTGQPQSLLKSDKLGTAPAGFSLEYSLTGADGSWSADAYKVTGANTTGYTVYYRTAGNDNYNPSASQNITSKVVAKGTPAITTAPTLIANFTYDGTQHTILASNGVATLNSAPISSAITYTIKKKAGDSWSDFVAATTDVTALKIKDVGEYKVVYGIPVSDANLNTVANAEVASVTIAPAPVTYYTKPATKVYGEADPAAFEVKYTGFVNEETIGGTKPVAGFTAPILERAKAGAADGNNVGDYLISVQEGHEPSATNYTFTNTAASNGYLSITPRTLDETADFAFTYDASDKTYDDGNKIIVPVTAATFKGDAMGVADYTYVCTNNENVGTANLIISGQGNFKGSVTKHFNITPKTIYIKPANAEKVYGADDPAPLTTYTLVNAAVNGVLVEGATLNGTVAFTRVPGNNVGTYTISVASYTPQEGVTDNYAPAALDSYTSNFVINPTGDGLVLKFKNGTTATKVYGDANPGWTINDLEYVSGKVGEDKWEEDIKPTLSTPVFDIASENVNAADNKIVLVSGLVSTNYPNVSIQDLAFTVTPRTIAVTVAPQTLNYGDDLIQAIAQWDPVDAKSHGGDWNGTTTDAKAALSVTLSVENLSTYGPGDTYEKVIKATSGNPNYVIDTDATKSTWGNLTVNAATAFAFDDSKDDNATKIAAFAAQTKNVKIKINRDQTLGKARTWAKESWNTLVLPFDISVPKLSEILGYCIVNVINPDKTVVVDGKSTEFYGKLTMKGAYGKDYIPANTPFMVKTTDALADIVDADGNIDFGSQKIIAPTNLSFDAGNGATFVGTYEKKTVTKEDGGNIWFMLGNQEGWAKIGTLSTNSWDIVPFAAYIQLPAACARVTFYMEEEDGTVTAIESVDAEDAESAESAAEGWYTINGVKLNAKPTQKGIYIFNGKKVAIQ